MEAQIAFVLKQAENGTSVGEVCRQSGISEATFYAWRKKYAGLCHPASIRVDQGSEFISRDLDLWAYTGGVTLDFSRPGKPTDNAFIESFNAKFRAECQN